MTPSLGTRSAAQRMKGKRSRRFSVFQNLRPLSIKVLSVPFRSTRRRLGPRRRSAAAGLRLSKNDSLSNRMQAFGSKMRPNYPKGTLSPPTAARARAPLRAHKVNCPAGAREGPLGDSRPPCVLFAGTGPAKSTYFTLFCCWRNKTPGSGFLNF